jgi:hypothetical protein
MNPRYHPVVFPNIQALIDGKRTCCHLLPTKELGIDDLRVDDFIIGLANHEAKSGFLYKITSSSFVHLLDDLSDETIQQNGYSSKEAYLKRWDEIHPQFLASSNPTVLRLAFQKTEDKREVFFDVGFVEMMSLIAKREIEDFEDKEFLKDIEKKVQK